MHCPENGSAVLRHSTLYMVAQKLVHLVLYALTLSNLFHCQNQGNICNNSVTKDPTTP